MGKMAAMKTTAAEGQDTVTEYERAIFAKLAMAYTVNSALVPLVLASVQSIAVTGARNPIDQTWYEEQGAVSDVVNLVVSNCLVVEGLKVVQLAPIAKRW